MQLSEIEIRKIIKRSILAIIQENILYTKEGPDFKIKTETKTGPFIEADNQIPYFKYSFDSRILSNKNSVIYIFPENNLTVANAENIMKECLKYVLEYFSSKRVIKFLLPHEKKSLQEAMKLEWVIQIGPFDSYSSAGKPGKYSVQPQHYISILYSGGSIKSAIESNKHEVKHIIADSAGLDLDKIQSESEKLDGNIRGMTGQDLINLDDSLHLHLNKTENDYKKTARHFLKQMKIAKPFRTYKKGFLGIIRKYVDYSTDYLEINPKNGGDRLAHMHNESHRAGVKVRSLYKAVQDKNPNLIDDQEEFKLEFIKLLNFEYDNNVYFNDRDLLRTLLALDVNKIKENAKKLASLYQFADNIYQNNKGTSIPV